MIVDPALAKARFDRDSEPLRASPAAFLVAGVRVVTVEFPLVVVGLTWRAIQAEILLQVRADEYDYLPVSGGWVDSSGACLLRGGPSRIPYGGGFWVDSHPHGGNRPWFCFAGWREFHDHVSHQATPWIQHRARPEYRIPGIVVQLAADLNKPGVQVV